MKLSTIVLLGLGALVSAHDHDCSGSDDFSCTATTAVTVVTSTAPPALTTAVLTTPTVMSVTFNATTAAPSSGNSVGPAPTTSTVLTPPTSTPNEAIGIPNGAAGAVAILAGAFAAALAM